MSNTFYSICSCFSLPFALWKYVAERFHVGIANCSSEDKAVDGSSWRYARARPTCLAGRQAGRQECFLAGTWGTSDFHMA